MLNTRVRLCEVKRSVSGSATEHTHVPKRMVGHDTEDSHNFRSDVKQFSTELGAKPSNTAPSYYI